MKNLSLSLKISSSFIVLSITTLALLYFVFYQLFEQHMLQVEEEKAVLIAQTIEPLIAVSYFLSLDEDVRQLAEKMAEHEQIAGLSVIIEGRMIWDKTVDDSDEYIRIGYPITNPLSSEKVGSINVAYTKEVLNKALQDIHREILYYLGVLAFVFVLFVVVVRYLFSPFGKIAEKVKNYQPGSVIDFSSVRAEPEVNAIVTAFESMVSNIREYTVLLERYKRSVDESAIVVRMDVNGKVSYVNDEFSRLSGYSKEESIGVSVFEICHPGEDKSHCAAMLETVANKKIWKGHLQNQRKNGGTYYVSATVVPILDEQESIVELISIQQDVTQVIEQQEQIVRQTTDLTTGLFNRVKMEEDISQVEEPKFAIISLDNYNVITDYYGRDSGKKILQEVAEIFLSLKNIEHIIVYKLAGSDFAVLGDQSLDMNLFHGICRAILEKINNYTIQLESGSIHIGASAGLTSDKDHLLSYAGLALEHAQKTRHLTIIYEETENLVQRFENNLVWTKKLNMALADERIVLFAQPILNSKSLKIEKYECLVRMIDEEDQSVISPYYFLDIAKQSKLYHQITRQVITLAFDAFSQIPEVDFSINLSLEDLLHIPTIEFLQTKLDETGLASRFIVEIVESEGIENLSEVTEFVAHMKERGCRIAIDDFGSGYSNFAYLMTLNVDYIKIDGSLIKAIDVDLNSKIITSTILDFAQQLEVETVAEFVHSQDVMDYVQKLGIDYVQGFHLGEPVPLEKLIG